MRNDFRTLSILHTCKLVRPDGLATSSTHVIIAHIFLNFLAPLAGTECLQHTVWFDLSLCCGYRGEDQPRSTDWKSCSGELTCAEIVYGIAYDVTHEVDKEYHGGPCGWCASKVAALGAWLPFSDIWAHKAATLGVCLVAGWAPPLSRHLDSIWSLVEHVKIWDPTAIYVCVCPCINVCMPSNACSPWIGAMSHMNPRVGLMIDWCS